MVTDTAVSEEKGGVKDDSSLSKMSNGWVEVLFPEMGNTGGRTILRKRSRV